MTVNPTEHRSFRERLSQLDKGALLAAAAIFALGVLSIYSATFGREEVFAQKQMLWGALAGVAYLLAVAIGHQRLLRYAYPLYWGTVAVLLLVPLLGATAKGAQSWFALGPFRLQPAEFGKIALALVLGKHLCRFPPRTPRRFFEALLLSGVGGGLVFLQPDLGSALVYGVAVFVALYVAGAPRRYLVFLSACVLAAVPIGWGFLKEYQRLRLLVFLDPQVDPLGAGYNVIQSRIAVGAGGLWGKGFLEGTQSKLRFLPEPHTDFIFSVFAEEFGFIGSMVLLSLFTWLMWRIVVAGLRSRDLRCKVVVSALAAWLWFQLVESVAMSIGYAPVTGLPLPLFSYGGSSLLAAGFALGIVQSVYIDAKRPFEEHA